MDSAVMIQYLNIFEFIKYIKLKISICSTQIRTCE